jgi:iron complex transport system substrate-binding protein
MRTPVLAAVLTLAVALTACGTDADVAAPADAAPATPAAVAASPSEAATAAAFPLTVTDSLGNETTFDAPVAAIVSLSPTATEMLFAIGAGDQVVAVDSLSNHPPEAPVTDLQAFQPSVEAVAPYDPDLVILADNPADMAVAFRTAEIPTLMLNTASSMDDVYAQIELLGEVTDHVDEAADLVARMQDEIAGIVDATPVPAAGLRYYHELDPTFYSVTSTTFIGAVYGLFGLTSIADEADGGASGYPQLSAEFILEADPDLIFLASTACCGQTAEVVGQRPGWAELTAIRDGHVVELDEDVVSRWGPRVVDFVRIVADAITTKAG